MRRLVVANGGLARLLRRGEVPRFWLKRLWSLPIVPAMKARYYPAVGLRVVGLGVDAASLPAVGTPFPCANSTMDGARLPPTNSTADYSANVAVTGARTRLELQWFFSESHGLSVQETEVGFSPKPVRQDRSRPRSRTARRGHT